MENKITEAANKWWRELGETDAYTTMALKYAVGGEITKTQILSAFLHKVAMSWWYGLSFVEQLMLKVKHKTYSISDLYLKEHESKEEWIMLSDREPYDGQKVTTYWDDGTECVGIWQDRLPPSGPQIIKWKPMTKLVKEEPLSTDTVESSPYFDNDKIRERRDYLLNIEAKNKKLSEALQKILEEIPTPKLPVTHAISEIAKEALKETLTR